MPGGADSDGGSSGLDPNSSKWLAVCSCFGIETGQSPEFNPTVQLKSVVVRSVSDLPSKSALVPSSSAGNPRRFTQ